MCVCVGVFVYALLLPPSLRQPLFFMVPKLCPGTPGCYSKLRHLGYFKFLRKTQRHLLETVKTTLVKLFGPNYLLSRTVRYFFWLRLQEKFAEALIITFAKLLHIVSLYHSFTSLRSVSM